MVAIELKEIIRIFKKIDRLAAYRKRLLRRAYALLAMTDQSMIYYSDSKYKKNPLLFLWF